MPLNLSTSNIVALAFNDLRLARVAGLSEDTDLGADVALAYRQARDEVGTLTDWSWSSWQADLPAVAPAVDGAPVADATLPMLFHVPPDSLALRAVGDATTRWQLEGVWLRADAPAPLRVRYSRRIENEEQIPAPAKAVIALRIAQMLLPRWGNTEDRRRVDDAFEVALTLARRTDARAASVQSWLPNPRGDIIAEALR
jgi:hypothetical protein